MIEIWGEDMSLSNGVKLIKKQIYYILNKSSKMGKEMSERSLNWMGEYARGSLVTESV